MIKNLIWDFDGSLFDTYPLMVEIFQSALVEFGHTASREQILFLMKDTLGKAVEHYLELGVGEGFYRLFLLREEAADPSLQPPFPYARRICLKVRDRGGKNLIITHRSRSTVMKLLYHHDMASLFSEIITKESGYRRKPDPEAFVAAIASHRLIAEETLSIGDRDLDILAAKSAGTRTCFFSQNGFSPSIPVDLIIHGLEELESFMDGDGSSK